MILRGLGALSLLILGMSLAAQACTCSQAPPGKCPGLQEGDVVFLGAVTAVEDVAPGLTRYRFHVDERFAGVDSSEIDVFSGGEDGDCAYRFKKGEQYLVFTQPGAEGRLFATICNGTRPAKDARALLPQLRAMRRGRQVASVFGVLRRADAPFLAPPDDPQQPLPNVALRLQSRDDRFQTSTGADGVYSFYDVHAGEYSLTASLPARMDLTRKTIVGALPPFKIPDGACYEYDVDALPTGHIQGSVLDPDGNPLAVASVELYRAGSYDDSRPGLWGFQGAKGVFDFDHVGPGEYIIVFNRANRIDPNSPFRRAFYPGVSDLSEAKPIKLKDGQDLLNVNMQVKDVYPHRKLRVRLKWQGPMPPGDVTVSAKADRGENPMAEQIGEGLYEFTLLESDSYTVSAWQDLAPQPAAPHRRKPACELPSRIDAAPISVSGSDAAKKEILLVFPVSRCAAR
ncbi:MAG: hypothetical protein LAN36_07160 [Acidobacteriia bacterium]|nr:hypothetical protein [Terriglobia bacterium]